MGRLRANISWKKENMPGPSGTVTLAPWGLSLWDTQFYERTMFTFIEYYMFCVSSCSKHDDEQRRNRGFHILRQSKKKISGWWYVQKYGSESDWMPSCLLCLLGLPWPQLTTTDHNNCLNHMFWPNTWPCTISYSHTEIRAQTFDSWSSGWGGSWRKPHFLPRFDWRRCHQRLWSGSDLAREESNAKWHWFFSHATNPGPWWLNAACALTRFLWGTSATIKHGRFVYRLLRCLE